MCNSVVEANMCSTRKKEKQQNRRLLCQLDDFDRDLVLSGGMSETQQSVVINTSSVDGEITGHNYDSILTTNENTVNVQTLERSFNERTDRETGNIVSRAEDRIQNAILTTVDNIFTPGSNEQSSH